MTKVRIVGAVLAVLVLLTASQVAIAGLGAQAKSASQPKPASAPKKMPAAEIDGLMAPVALYPDQLLAQMLVCAATPARVTDLDKWLKTNPPFKGTALQDAAKQSKFEPSFVALVPFPQVVDFMATNLDWTTEVGQAFSTDRAGVLDSVQRLRADSLKTGKLKSTPQQDVSLKTTESGQQVIVIEPANPQVVYVPQYSTQTVYSQPPTTTTVVVQEEDDDAAEAMAAGLIGFTAGIAIGAAMDNDYYYGPYGWHGSPYMYNDAWDDWYDDREDAREDWYDNREDAREDYADHREDMADSRSDRASNAQEQRTERQSTAQQQRTERQQSGQSSTASTQSARGSGGTSTSARATGQAATPSTQSASGDTSSYQARGQDRDRSSTAAARSGTGSDAFSNYSSGKSERSASARGQSSRAGGGGGGSRGGGGGSRGGGGGRRR
jgi:Protein of unknown function (DUF3300)